MIATSNCTIVFKAEAQTPATFDPITGEPVFTVTTVEQSFRASLERDTNEPTLGLLPGRDKTDQLYYGRSELKPSQMPTWYQPSCQLELRFDNSFTCQGYVYFSHLSRLRLDNIFGTAIEIIVNY